MFKIIEHWITEYFRVVYGNVNRNVSRLDHLL